ncbi:MocR-like pyridoxine biosynthesis transcription factor PdxR [Pygmaiobacter massiliensis]|uniref:MocR-like pyridoxine biosynthesis transcription factor PdxR n=1 Tax=Pygmaiobacter massiliensis TaxID=1917873 RepID=UPI0028969351|nr:PLP-dependent aminotransferase family protein [Pygmaiobacter massiliensis]
MDYLALSLDPEQDQPLYQQLYRYLAEEIAAGRLPAGEKLPARRVAAQALGVSRNTVETAYAMLEDEGYIETRERSGQYVADVSPLVPSREIAVVPDVPPVPEAEYTFSTRSMDATLFPARTWARIEKEVLYTEPGLLNHGQPQGDLALRSAIAQYLAGSRAVRCSPEQIVVGAGIEYLLGLLARLLGGRLVATEDPGYEKTAIILHNNGTPTVPVQVDGSGMSISALRESGAQVAYVTPSHQFPTGVSMPVGRRTELLGWAGENPERLIIEDDYDSEFRFDGRPIPSLQGLGGNRVVYISTFTKSIAPSIRIAYMVLPPQVLADYRRLFGSYSSTVSRFEQHTLAHFLARGHFARYLNRARSVYRRRRDLLENALIAAFGEERLEFGGTHTGLYFTVQFRLGKTEQQLIDAAAKAGVQVSGLSPYYHCSQYAPGATLVLGYASMDEEKLEQAVARLGRAFLS